MLLQASVSHSAEYPIVHEVAMAAPDIVSIEVREGPVLEGGISELPEPSAAPRGSETTLPDGRSGIVVGPLRKHIRTYDTADFVRLDRATIDRPQEYPQISGLNVVGVYRKSVPWSSGRTRSLQHVSAFQHFIYLKLSRTLSEGKHTIRWPGDALPPTVFTFDDSETRATAIRGSQLGYAPTDTSKLAYLALWLPGAPEKGAVDFRRYGLRRFEIADQRGVAVFSGDIRFRVGPRDIEAFDGLGRQNDLITYLERDQTEFTANRAGTYVFDLDFSALDDPAPGMYRIRIPGLGVSDEFPISRTIWMAAAKTAMGGLYNQRSGMELDGRFGYSRPECFTKKSGVEVLQSQMPIVFGTEGGGRLSISAAAVAPWITASVVPHAWGGYQDAGDWDRRIDHVASSYLLLDVYEQLPTSTKRAPFGTPRSDDVLPLAAYRGIDLPDIVDEAVWNIDLYRRLQRPDGAVRGGIESASTPRPWEPCWLESQTVFAYAPDPGSAYKYAAAAAKLAIVLKGLDQKPLAHIYRDSALMAWQWAEAQLQQPDLGLGTAFSIAAFGDEETSKKIEMLRTAFGDSRLWAAGALYRLTGEPRFNEAVRERFSAGWVDIGWSRADGAWEYAQANSASADFALQAAIKDRIIETARISVSFPQLSRVAYRNMKHRAAPMFWGEGGPPSQNEISLLIRAHKLTSAKEFLNTMYDGSAHILGANQVGKSFTVGLGKRWPFAPLHENTIAAGLPPPEGITVYGWASQSATSYPWIWDAPWAALPEFEEQKRVDPYRFSMPLYEYFIEHPGIIMSQEYTVQQTIASTAAMWLYLAGQIPPEQ